MLKGVLDVEENLLQSLDDWVIDSRIRQEYRRKIFDVLETKNDNKRKIFGKIQQIHG